MRQWFFEDFSAGQHLPPGEHLVEAEDAAWFAAGFAPAAVEGAAWPEPRQEGGVAGWYVAALGMRMIYDAFLRHTASLGAPGIEEMEWPRPVLVGDRLRLDGRIASLRASRSRPEMGLVGFDFIITDQTGARVMRQRNIILVQRRQPEGEA